MKKLLLPLVLVALLNAPVHGQGTCATATTIAIGQYAVPPLTGTATSLVCVGASTVAATGTEYKFFTAT